MKRLSILLAMATVAAICLATRSRVAERQVAGVLVVEIEARP